jgi:DNA-binding NarL/FixJ family response regulator
LRALGRQVEVRELGAAVHEAISVAAASPYGDVQRAVARAIAGDPLLHSAGASKTGRDLLELGSADVALVDRDICGPAFLPTCAALSARPGASRVLMVALSVSEVDVRRALAARTYGIIASGDLATLGAAVRGAIAGAFWLAHDRLTMLPDAMSSREARAGADSSGRPASLTRRERETLRLLAAGCSHNEIARRLVVSPHTARTHIQNLLTKLGVHSRLEAVAVFAGYERGTRSPAPEAVG